MPHSLRGLIVRALAACEGVRSSIGTVVVLFGIVDPFLSLGLPAQPGLQVGRGVEHGLPLAVADPKTGNRAARGCQPPKGTGANTQGLRRFAVSLDVGWGLGLHQVARLLGEGRHSEAAECNLPCIYHR